MHYGALAPEQEMAMISSERAGCSVHWSTATRQVYFFSAPIIEIFEILKDTVSKSR